MNEKEMLEVNIKNLKDTYNVMQGALNNLKDVDDFDNESYENLYNIAENINDLRIQKEIELEKLEERKND